MELGTSISLNQCPDLAIQINKLIEQRKLTQAKAADILGIARPRVSDLKRGQLDKFSMEKLL